MAKRSSSSSQSGARRTPRSRVGRSGEAVPESRRLRVYAFDPSLGMSLSTIGLNEIVQEVDWEDELKPGPIGEYLEVIDVDPASGSTYTGVDLNDPYLLARDGLAPSQNNPKFHQQMVYAASMATIKRFELALGRRALWSTRFKPVGGRYREEFVRRLRIYPHALREANAYYSPARKALLFGYFPSAGHANSPPGMLYTCLSHDIVAHETTHALLDGLHPHFNTPTNPDVLAFHEAFADIVALLQRFSVPEILVDQIRRTRGDLRQQSMLGKLAQQLGQSISRSSALRDALGKERNGVWEPRAPDPTLLERTPHPHARGSILVAAVFRAFLSVYESRTEDLLRIATQGSGVLSPGNIHPDLVNRMAHEASRSAQHILRMCIRALDYCPPVDITFGDYLRSIITADIDAYPKDEHNYRVAFVEAFRAWGIRCTGVLGHSPDLLCWPTGEEVLGSNVRLPSKGSSLSIDWDLDGDREQAWNQMNENGKELWRLINHELGPKFVGRLGLTLNPRAPASVYRSRMSDLRLPSTQVNSVRTAVRPGAGGRSVTDLVVEIVQRRRGYFDPKKQARIDRVRGHSDTFEKGDFTYTAGCTLLIDPNTLGFRYVVCSRGTILDNDRLEEMRAYLAREDPAGDDAFYARPSFGTEWVSRVHRMC